MSKALDDALQRVREAARAWARKDAHMAVAELAYELGQAAIDEANATAKSAVRDLLANRWFDLCESACAPLIGRRGASVTVRRRYAQALLEKSAFDPALSVLESLEPDTRVATAEREEVLGLIGRIHKQRFVVALNGKDPSAGTHLKRSIEVYLSSYLENPAERTWSGINAVALLVRAGREGLSCAGAADPRRLAQAILDTIEAKDDTHKAASWDLATAAEACLALDRLEATPGWLQRYCGHAEVDAFSLGSTLRQFEEIWQLNTSGGPGLPLVDLLRASLLRRQNGAVVLSGREVQSTLQKRDNVAYEKVFGKDSFVTFEGYLRGIERCRNVARIGKEKARGEGTGFLMRGSDLNPAWGDQAVLVTNAHVLSETDPEAIHPEEAVVTFEAHGTIKPDESFRVVTPLLKSFSRESLDVTVARLDRDVPLESPLPIAPVLPIAGRGARVIIVGHPGGGTLSFSLNDNELLECELPRLHYRTPTEGGSSGSPVFNQDWKLVAVHHAGSDTMPRLRSAGGTYQANEGIAIKSIIEAIRG